MKKSFIAICLAALTAVAFTSCKKNEIGTAQLNNKADSLNYAYGLANAVGLKGYYFVKDSTQKFIDAFMKGFDKAYKRLEPTDKIYNSGLAFGYQLQSDIDKGFLMGDSGFIAKSDLLLNAINNTIDGKELFMPQDEANAYYQNIITLHTAQGVAFTEAQIDSLNNIFGMLNGLGIKQYLSSIDSTEQGLAALRKGIEAGRKKSKDETYNKYVMGLQMASQIYERLSASPTLEISDVATNFDMIRAGIIDGMNNCTSIMTSQEANTYYMDEMNAQQEKKTAALYSQNKTDGENFLAKNGKRPEVTTTESGLQYEVLKQSKGPKPVLTDRVTVHYHGTLLDSTVFDSSVERGKPATFGVSEVIPGWTEALQLMPVGSKWRLYIPQQLAYGSRAAGSIPPYSMLIFDIELLKIEPATNTQPAQ